MYLLFAAAAVVGVIDVGDVGAAAGGVVQNCNLFPIAIILHLADG